ncbi:hypothetical protein ABT255_03240 [Streptomyces mirabilis]|uniref:hypothetical protein n=1 Tax=Streptomyces mirabilis TaxID=68239 RepID=UPI0033195C37
MTGTTPEISKLQLAGALILVARTVQARATQATGDPNGTVHVDRRVCLQAAADMPTTARFDRNAWVKAWQAAGKDGSLPARKAVYRLLCQTLADELDFDGDSWEGEHSQAEIYRIASRIRSVDTKVCIDDMLGPLDAKVDPHNLWNGFVSPRFTLDAARELADQTQRLAEEYGADGVDTVHVIDAGGKDRDGKPLAFVLRVSWVYLAEEGAQQSTLIIEPDDEGRYAIGGWEWCWSYSHWNCACGRYSDWHERCWCGLTRDHQPTAPLEVATWTAAAALRRLAPSATSALIDIHEGRAHIVAVYAGDTEIDTADDGDVFDTETLGAADTYLQNAIEQAAPADLAAAPGWMHTPDETSAHLWRITLPTL